jgi:hypothetical protein
MADIFNREVSRLNGVFTADRVKLTLPQNLGVLVQQFQASYSQTITRLYEVGANDQGRLGQASNIYYVGGRTQGNLSLARVVGPSNTIKEMYSVFGDVCTPESFSISLQETDCLGEGGGDPGEQTAQLTYTFKNAVIQQVGLSVAAQDMIINESSAMMFSSLEVE